MRAGNQDLFARLDEVAYSLEIIPKVHGPKRYHIIYTPFNIQYYMHIIAHNSVFVNEYIYDPQGNRMKETLILSNLAEEKGDSVIVIPFEFFLHLLQTQLYRGVIFHQV